MPLAPVSIAAQQSGVEFDVKTVISVSGGMSAALGGMTPGYSGHGFALGKRLRIDIVDGALPPLADKGDYMLFDSTGITVVHPSKKEFVPYSAGLPQQSARADASDGHDDHARRHGVQVRHSSRHRHDRRISDAPLQADRQLHDHDGRHGHEPADEKPGDERVLDGDGPRTRPESAAASRPARWRHVRT